MQGTVCFSNIRLLDSVWYTDYISQNANQCVQTLNQQGTLGYLSANASRMMTAALDTYPISNATRYQKDTLISIGAEYPNQDIF